MLATALATLAFTGAAEAPKEHNSQQGCQTRSCERRVKKRKAVKARYSFCNTWKCVTRADKKRIEREMRRYKRNPLPWCTWGPESGKENGQWSMVRYRMPNKAGGDGGGKFQIMLATWRNFGGVRMSGVKNPIYAPPVIQERVARLIAADGLHHWVNC